jgi:phosphohistidine phosphatase
MNYARAIELNSNLYLSSPRDHLEVVRSLPDAEHRVMLVGHNPGLSQFLNELADTEAELATCDLAQIELPFNRWAELEKSACAQLIQVWHAGDGD